MTRDEAVAFYIAVPQTRKCNFLLTLAHELTIACRRYYRNSDEVDAQSIPHFEGVCELMHHISAEARHHLNEDADRYPDDVLLRTLFDKAEYFGLTTEFGTAVHYAVKLELRSLE